MTQAMRIAMALATGAASFAPAAAAAQMHDMHDMHGMQMSGMAMPAKPVTAPVARPKSKADRAPAKAATRTSSTAGHTPAGKTPAGQDPAGKTKVKTTMGAPMAMPHHAMPMTMLGGMADHTPPGIATKEIATPCPPEHVATGHCPLPTSAGTGPGTGTRTGMALVGTDQPAGNAPPPAPPVTLAAAGFYDPATMALANRMMRNEHGGMRFSQILFNLAEVQVRAGRDGYRWDGDGWFGGDIDRFVVKSEGEGDFTGKLQSAEVEALYSRAVDPYWNVQAGLRQDFAADTKRTYATIGIEGLAPYWFDVAGSVFVSDKGDILGRAEAWYDQRVTQRIVLQPRIELNLAAQDIPGSRIGAGLSDAELGLRLRYEIAREFAPYLGLSWQKRYPPSRDVDAVRDNAGGFALVLGLRGWL